MHYNISKKCTFTKLLAKMGINMCKRNYYDCPFIGSMDNKSDQICCMRIIKFVVYYSLYNQHTKNRGINYTCMQYILKYII